MAPPSPIRYPTPPRPSSSATLGDRGKALSPDAAPFVPASAGRTKAAYWEDGGLMDCSDDDGEDLLAPEEAYR